MHLLFSIFLCLFGAWVSLPLAQLTVFDNDDDLERYVSRPDIRPPKFDTEVYDEQNIAKGYWFVSPYADLMNRRPTRLYEPHQIGPHIYDRKGDLVWSGAGMFPGRNVFDFKAVETTAGTRLTFLLAPNEHEEKMIGGAGIILDETLQEQRIVRVNKGTHMTNMHEFTLMLDGKTAVTFVHETRLVESDSPSFHGWVIDLGFIEIDVKTGETLFEWWALDHVHPTQSTVDSPSGAGEPLRAWDYFHINSVDKDEEGDYLVSARHCNTIYKISGKDGSIIWQLGGKSSTFEQRGFHFSSQHDARFRGRKGSSTLISFLNNASDGKKSTADISSGMIVTLDTSSKPMIASLVREYARPDGGRTNLRGNFQILPKSQNLFVGWSERGYISEFDADGNLLLSARFASDRFASYRSFKFNFTANPHNDPDLVCSAFGTSRSTATTVCHVSWNGATEVYSWNFYSVLWNGKVAFIGDVLKQGFETAFMSDGCSSLVFAEALDKRGRGLRNSSMVAPTKIPGYDYQCGAPTKKNENIRPKIFQPPETPRNSLFMTFPRVVLTGDSTFGNFVFYTLLGAIVMLVVLNFPGILRYAIRRMRTKNVHTRR